MRDEWKELIGKEMMKDAARIMEETNADSSLKDVKAPEELHERVFAQIREYEEQKAYEQLSEKNKELVRLGKVYKKRRKWNQCLVLVAALVVVLAVGSVCIGEDGNIFDIISTMLTGGEHIIVDSEDTEPFVYVEENEVFEEIENEYGFIPVKLEYLPDNTVFYEAVFNKDLQYINMIYEMDDETSLIYIIRPNYRESSYGTVIEDEKIQEYEMNINDVVVTLTEYYIEDSGQNRWFIYFEYQDVQYQLGLTDMKQGEVEEIVNNLGFLE